MAIKPRVRTKAAASPDIEAFVSGGGTLDKAEASAQKAAASKKSGNRPSEGWRDRARTAKKTEATPFRFNKSQQDLLRHAKEVDGRDYSKILEELVWPALEEKYGADVPLPEAE